MQANEQGGQVEVLKVKKIIVRGPQGKLGFLKLWDCILDYYTVLLLIKLLLVALSIDMAILLE